METDNIFILASKFTSIYSEDDFVICGNKYYISVFENKIKIFHIINENDNMMGTLLLKISMSVELDYFIKMENSTKYKEILVPIDELQIKYFEEQVEKLLNLRAFV